MSKSDSPAQTLSISESLLYTPAGVSIPLALGADLVFARSERSTPLVIPCQSIIVGCRFLPQLIVGPDYVPSTTYFIKAGAFQTRAWRRAVERFSQRRAIHKFYPWSHYGVVGRTTSPTNRDLNFNKEL